MKAFWSQFVSVSSLGLLWAGIGIGQSGAEPFVPKDDDQVLERVGTARLDPGMRQLQELRARVRTHPLNVATAAELARRCIDRGRAEGDPRYLGRAQAALGPWWDSEQPPGELLVLRATIKQSQHDFTNALVDLDRAVRLPAVSGQAWLTRATVLTVLGRYDEARSCCLALVRRASELVAVTASASIAGLTGQAERARLALVEALVRNPSAPTAERLWTLTLLAEICERLGLRSDAELHFRAALALGERDVYLLGAFADFLLDQGRADEAIDLLKAETRVDSLLLRLALAESALDPTPASFARHVKTLQTRFEEMRLRGDSVHQREEARFALALLNRPLEALRLAQANWSVQREPIDARILFEAARKAGQPDAAADALHFVSVNQLEDVRLKRLIEALQQSL